MYAQILAELLKAAQANPQSFLSVLQMVLDILKAHPDLLSALIKHFEPKA